MSPHLNPQHNQHHDNRDGDDARVIPLRPAPHSGDGSDQAPSITPAPVPAVVPEPIDAELVTAEESAALDRRLAAQRARDAAVAVARVVRVGVTHDRTRRTGRAVKRTAGYALAGSRIRRAERRARRKHLDLEQAITTLRMNAKSAEDFHTLRGLEEVLEARKTGAAERGRRKRIEVLYWTGGVMLVFTTGHAIVLGHAAIESMVGTGSLTDRWADVTGFWASVVDASPVGSYWWGWAAAGAVAWLARVIPAGRDRGTLPVWAGPEDTTPADGRSVIPDESTILNALRHLGGLPALKQAFKEGWGSRIVPTWIATPYKDGDGYRVQLVLPSGVPVEEIVKRKTVLAHNLVRLPVEVWPSEPKDRPGVLDLWIANQGALSGPVGDWPLLADLDNAQTDFFASIPLGLNIRGEIVNGLLFEKNYAAAGVMGSGKSSLFITLAAGAILDPLVEVDVFVLAENFDYEPMKPRLRTLRTGADRDTITACLDTLKALYDDLSVRGAALREHQERRVNRKLAAKDSRLRPRVVIIDECQNLFMDEEYGETATDVAVKLIGTARKYGVVVMFATPEASTTSLPRKIMAVTSCKACFAIGDQQSNDAILGTGSYKAGISAVSLEPKTEESPGDVGTAMVRGVMAKPGLLRGFYLTPDDLADVTRRAMELRDNHTTDTDQPDDQAAETVDFLTDLATVLTGHKHLRTAEVLTALAALRPGHYGKHTSRTLADELRAVGVPIVKRDSGQSAVDTNDVTEAVTIRDMNDGADGDSDH
jgi:S-DNA-T family DNA segregation ATPase FtsK/SpoIIIE